MESLADSIIDIRKYSHDMVDAYNKSVEKEELTKILTGYLGDSARMIHVPDQQEWEDFFTKFKDDSWDLIKKETKNLGLELLDTVTANYKGFLSGYKQWKENLISFIGAESFGDIYNKYQKALFGKLESDPKIIINGNEFEREDTGISLDYDKKGETPKDYILKTNTADNAIETTSRRSRGRSINDFLNKSVGALLLSGPDLQKNMFDVFLVYHNEEGDEKDNTKFVMFCAPTESLVNDENSNNDESSDSNLSTVNLNLSAPMQSLIEDVYMLTVRTQSVEIPGRSRNTGTWNWIGTGIDVAQSDWDYKPTSSITVDLDANLYVYDIFNALSGFVRPGTYGSGHYYSSPDERPQDKDNLYRVLSPGKIGYEKNTIDLCVPIHKLSNYVDGKVDYTSIGADILFVFEDVRFLGVGDTITFNNETATRQSITVPFIFKNIRTVYRTDTTRIQEEKEVTAFSSEMQKYIFDHAGDPEGLIK